MPQPHHHVWRPVVATTLTLPDHRRWYEVFRAWACLVPGCEQTRIGTLCARNDSPHLTLEECWAIQQCEQRLALRARVQAGRHTGAIAEGGRDFAGDQDCIGGAGHGHETTAIHRT